MGDEHVSATPSRGRPRLERLEAVRGAAAVYVLAHHIIRARLGLQSGVLGFFFGFGQEAVLVFFLLSGFVIFYSFASSRDQSFSSYCRRRAVRIFPIYLFALVVSAVCAGPMIALTEWKELLGNLLMVQDVSVGKPGNWVETFAGNWPLWSLSYEWWFYMMFFPIYTRVSSARQNAVALAISLVGIISGVVWPNPVSRFTAYFFIWWSGAELARVHLRHEVPSLRSQSLSLAGLSLFSLILGGSIWSWVHAGHALAWGLYPVLQFRHFTLALLWLVAGILWAQARWIGFDVTLGWFKIVAPFSYGLYVLHFPIAISSRWIPISFPLSLQIVLPVCAAVLLAWIAEIKLQSVIQRFFSSRARSVDVPRDRSV